MPRGVCLTCSVTHSHPFLPGADGLPHHAHNSVAFNTIEELDDILLEAAALKVFQLEPDDLVLGQPLIVRSPIAGEIVTDRIVIGQYIKEDAEPVAVIANLSKVWVAAHVKEKDMRMIQSLDSVEVRLLAMFG